jgi:hypothetical protein
MECKRSVQAVVETLDYLKAAEAIFNESECERIVAMVARSRSAARSHK